jgi:uracil-DNA glycosylase family 4
MTHPPFAHSSGPRTAKIAIVGEAWGEQEALLGLPFMGSSGQELTRMLSEAGIERKECFLTNVFALRPANSNFDNLCAKKADVGKDYSHPPIKLGHYIKPEFLGEVTRLQNELEEIRPNLIIALGGTATWALLNSTKIGAIRGTIAASPWGKILPTFHPSAVLRNWSWRVICIADFIKAKRESLSPEIIRPERTVLVNPTLEELGDFVKRASEAEIIACDIETKKRQITCIGFALSRKEAFVVPFTSQEGESYWSTLEEEVCAWKLVKILLENPVLKLFQNGLYDLQYIMKMGILPKNCQADTMLLHHALFPELQKGLGFLGSIYTQEASWKLMRHKNVEVKADD